MQFFPFAGLAVRIAKSVIEEVASSSGPARTGPGKAGFGVFKDGASGGEASRSKETEGKTFEEILRDLGADGRREESAGNGEKKRLVVDPRTGRIMLVGANGKAGKEAEGKDGELILPGAQQNGEAAKEILKARIKNADKSGEAGASGIDASEELKKAIRALMSGEKVEIGADKLKLTKEDFAALKAALAEFGLSKAEIDELGDKVESKAGLTWGAFASLLGKLVGENLLGASREIGKAETRHLQNFFQKLGFTPQKSASLINDLKNGKFDKVWQEVGARVSRMPESSVFVLEAEELKVLSEVMNLSDKSSSRLLGLLSGAEGGRIGKQELRLIAATLAQEAAESGAGEIKRMEALREAVANAFKLAREREEALRNADAREDGSARKYRALASESREAREGDKNSKGEGAREGEVASRWLDDKKAAGKGESAEKTQADKDGSAAAAGNKEDGKKPAAAVRDGERYEKLKDAAGSGGKSESRGESGSYNGRESQAGKDGEPTADDRRAMRDFLARIGRESADADEPGAGKFRIDPNAVAEKAAQAAQAQQRAFDVLNQAGRGTAAQVLRQVQAGMFKAMGAGRNQLTLRLDPPDLGKVHLMLQVTRNEVNAVIRAESPDAARMVQDQLAQIRQSLEQQGLKVSRLEVQTQAQHQNQQNQDAWQGAEQHNQAREQARRAGLAGLWTRNRTGGEPLAQEMHNPDESAINSREGLDIFA